MIARREHEFPPTNAATVRANRACHKPGKRRVVNRMKGNDDE